MSTQIPAAVLWDMDGTIVDTEPLWYIAEDQLGQEHNTVISDEDRHKMTGMGLWDAAAIIQASGVQLSSDEIVADLTSRVSALLDGGNMPWRPGAMELLEELHAESIPVALVTMSTRSLTDQILKHLPVSPFTITVCGDEVEAAKPAPDPYLRAAELLAVDIAECVAFEDSLTGLRSAWSSGAVSIGIPHLMDLTGTSYHELWPTLHGKSIEDVSRIFNAARNVQSQR